MTNNINGIDVSECEFYEETRELPDNLNGCYYIQHNYCGLQGDNYCICNKNPDCDFKQFKRLEQREKALTEIADDLQKRNHDLTLTNERLEEENKELKKRQISKIGFLCDCEQNEKYRQALEEIKNIAEKLITETPEYHSCYYKDECGDNCTPKQQGKVEYCCYENADKILTIIDEVLND